MRTSNPVLTSETFGRGATGMGIPGAAGERMSTNGVVGKCVALFVLVAFSFTWMWERTVTDAATAQTLTIGAMVIGVLMSLALSFKPQWSPIGAPLFALVEGAFLGGVSAWYESGLVAGGYDGIVMQAALATLGTFVTMLLIYRARIIKVTERFRAVVTTAFLSIFVVYGLAFVLSIVGVRVPFLNDASPIGIGISVVVIVVASLMLLVDFDMIERGAATGAPKYMEWYGAFALLVTIVWIYVEFLRLLSKLRR